MKYIAKGAEPNSFSEWKRVNSGINWDGFHDTEMYRELKDQLVVEQDELCCYCEIYLHENKGSHIEHYRPKSRYPLEEYSYENLLVSCQCTDSCGHKKQGKYFPELVSPLSKDCQEKFIYTGDGSIIPKDVNDAHAQKTIDLLGLNCQRLKGHRMTILKQLELAGSDEFTSYMQIHFKEKFGGFYTVVKYFEQKESSGN